MRAVLLNPDGTVEEALIEAHAESSNMRVRQALEGMRRLIGGGYIEIVRARGLGHLCAEFGRMPRAVMVVDDEGSLRPTPLLNRRASNLYGGAIFGPVLIVAEALTPDDDGVEEPDLAGLEVLDEPEAGWVSYLTAITD